jgi:hypothetical protein
MRVARSAIVPLGPPVGGSVISADARPPSVHRARQLPPRPCDGSPSVLFPAVADQRSSMGSHPAPLRNWFSCAESPLDGSQGICPTATRTPLLYKFCMKRGTMAAFSPTKFEQASQERNQRHARHQEALVRHGYHAIPHAPGPGQ